MPENFVQIYLAAAATVSSCKEKNDLLLPHLKHNLQDIRIISVFINGRVHRYFARFRRQMLLQFLPFLAAGRFLEQPGLCPRFNALIRGKALALIYIRELHLYIYANICRL